MPKTSLSFYEKIVIVIKAVPKGRVVTYGQVAALCGSPGGSRQVAWTLHSSSRKHKLPWHRVINAQGEISLTGEYYVRQQVLLEREGVEFDSSDRVNLKIFQWKPKVSMLSTLFRQHSKV